MRLHCFIGVFLHYTESKTYNFALIIPKNYPIIPELFLILSTTYYSRNYSGIIDGSLALGDMAGQCFIFIYRYLSIKVYGSNICAQIQATMSTVNEETKTVNLNSSSHC